MPLNIPSMVLHLQDSMEPFHPGGPFTHEWEDVIPSPYGYTCDTDMAPISPLILPAAQFQHCRPGMFINSGVPKYYLANFPPLDSDEIPSSSSLRSSEYNPFDTAFGAVITVVQPHSPAENATPPPNTHKVNLVIADSTLVDNSSDCLSDHQLQDANNSTHPPSFNKFVWDDIDNAKLTDSDMRCCWITRSVMTSSHENALTCRIDKCEATKSSLRQCEVWGGTLEDCEVEESLLVDVTITRGALEFCLLERCKLEGDVKIGKGVGMSHCTQLVKGREVPCVVE